MRKNLVVLLIAFLCASSLTLGVIPSYGTVSANSWITRASMPTDAYGGQAAVVDGKIYVIGGFYSANNFYDPSADNWTARSPLPNGVSINGAVAYQSKIYCIGAKVTEAYDPSTDSWEAKTPMPVSITGSVNVINGEIYVTSGYDYPAANHLLGITQVYNIANDSWTTKSSIPYPVSAYASTVCDNKIYVMGGQDPALGMNLQNVNFTQIYDPSNDSWSFGAPMPTKVLAATACATTGITATSQVYLFGGYGGADLEVASNLTQVYNPLNNSWSYGAQMLSPRVEFAVANVNDSLYVIGGSNVGLGAPYILSNEQYIPIESELAAPTSSLTPSPTSSAAVPELSWLTLLPLFLSVFSVALLVKRRKTVNHRN